MAPRGDPKEEEGEEEGEKASLDALLEKVEAWQKEVEALKDGGASREKEKGLYGMMEEKKKKGVLATLDPSVAPILDLKVEEKEAPLDSLWDGATQMKVKDLQGKQQGVLPTLGPPVAPILDLKEEEEEEEDSLQDGATPKKVEDLQEKLRVLSTLNPTVISILDPLKEEEEEALCSGAPQEKVEDPQEKLGVLPTLDTPVPPTEDPEEEASLDALLEKADPLQKEVCAPQSGATQRKVNDLQGEHRVPDTPLTSILDPEEEEATLYALHYGATQEKVMGLQGNWRVLTTLDSLPPVEDPEEEEEATLDALLEKADALQKEVGDLQNGATLRGKVNDLEGKRGVLALALRDFVAKEIWALEQEAEALWDAWFLNTLRNIPLENVGWFQEKVGALNNALREFVTDTPVQKKMSALEKMEALRDASQEDGGALRHTPLERDALWEKVTELNFALWEIQLDRTVALQGVVDACWDALREAPQDGVGALLEKLKAMQDVLRAAPLKELSALNKITSALLDAMVDFPRDVPAQEKQNALWDALQDVPLKAMGDLWGKVRTLWGIPLKMFAVWEKVYNLKVFLWDDSQNRVCNLQENVEALKDVLRDALWEEMGAEQDMLSALWASVQSFPISKLVALQDKLNALEERLNILEEKHPPLKETESASQKGLGSLHRPSQGELAELPEEEEDALQRSPTEEITEADKSDFLPTTPDPGMIQRNPGNAHLLQPSIQPWTAPQMNHSIPVIVTSFSMQGQVPNAAFPNAEASPGLQNGQVSCALETHPPLLQPALPLSATASVLSNQHKTASGMTPLQPAVPSQSPTCVSSFAMTSTPVADLAPDVDQIQSRPGVDHTTDSNAVLNHSAASDDKEGSILRAILTTRHISPGHWHASQGILSVTQQGNFSKTEQMIKLSEDHTISITSSQPDYHRRSKGQNIQETEELICEDVLEAPLASSEQTSPELASSEPPHKKWKMDALHNSQEPTLDQEMVKEYKKYRKCVLTILNQYKSRVGKLRTRLKHPLNENQNNQNKKDTEEIKALTSTLKRELAILEQFDCFQDVHKSKDDP